MGLLAFESKKTQTRFYSKHAARTSPEHHDIKLGEAVAAIMTAPVYFEKKVLHTWKGHREQLVDGTFLESNPTLVAVVQQKTISTKPVRVVSFGAGHSLLMDRHDWPLEFLSKDYSHLEWNKEHTHRLDHLK